MHLFLYAAGDLFDSQSHGKDRELHERRDAARGHGHLWNLGDFHYERLKCSYLHRAHPGELSESGAGAYLHGHIGCR